jgi:hypothetical protein
MMRGKIYFFFKKSIWRYLIGTLIIGFLAPLGSFNGTTSFVIYFAGLMMIVFPLMIISAKVMANKMKLDADIEFGEEKIIINHRNKELVETKDWNWIKEIDSKKNRFYFVLNERTPFGISIPKFDLTSEEIEFFERKKKTSR